MTETGRHIQREYEEDVAQSRKKAENDALTIKDAERARMIQAWENIADDSDDSKSTFKIYIGQFSGRSGRSRKKINNEMEEQNSSKTKPIRKGTRAANLANKIEKMVL